MQRGRAPETGFNLPLKQIAIIINVLQGNIAMEIMPLLLVMLGIIVVVDLILPHQLKILSTDHVLLDLTARPEPQFLYHAKLVFIAQTPTWLTELTLVFNVKRVTLVLAELSINAVVLQPLVQIVTLVLTLIPVQLVTTVSLESPNPLVNLAQLEPFLTLKV